MTTTAFDAFDTLLHARSSCRAFLDRPVPREVTARILASAQPHVLRYGSNDPDRGIVRRRRPARKGQHHGTSMSERLISKHHIRPLTPRRWIARGSCSGQH